MQTFSAREIINRLKLALSLPTDNALSDYLGIGKAALSNWKRRNTIDFLLIFSKCEHLNLDWVVMGRGGMYIDGEKRTLPNHEGGTGQAPGQDLLIGKALEQAEEIGRLRERIRHLEAKLGEIGGISDTFEDFLEEATSERNGAEKAG